MYLHLAANVTCQTLFYSNLARFYFHIIAKVDQTQNIIEWLIFLQFFGKSDFDFLEFLGRSNLTIAQNMKEVDIENFCQLHSSKKGFSRVMLGIFERVLPYSTYLDLHFYHIQEIL